MPNTTPATGEALPKTETLLETIQAYRAAFADFTANAPADDDAAYSAYADKTYVPLLRKLDGWDEPASTFEEAVEALKTVNEAGGFYHCDAGERMISAALTFFEAQMSEHPWTKARRLMKERSATLADCDSAKWSAYVMPPVPPVFNGFTAYPMGQKPDELPIDHVERLSWELSEALSRYQNGAFQAVVLPSVSAGHTVMLTKLGVFDLRAKA